MYMTRFGVVLVASLLAGEARAQGWSDFAAAFPAFPCQDGWAACLVGGGPVTPELAKDDAGRALPSDLRVGWFDLKATATFSPFGPLSAYTGGARTVAATEPPPEPQPDDGVAQVDTPRETRASQEAQQRAEEAAADADAARAAQEEAQRLAREAAAEKKRMDEEARAKAAAEAAARKEADALARKAAEAAARAEASERAALERQAAEAKARAEAAERERMAADEAARKQREAEEAARAKAAEEERKRKEAEAAKLAAEEEARRKAEEERRRQEELARQEAERKAAAEAAAVAAAAAEAARKAAAEEEARKAAAAAGTEPANDGAAMVETPDPAPAAAVADGDCSDTTKLEPTALLGKLTDGQVACLEGSLSAAPKMTEKKKISLVLMANAWSKGDKNAWEALVKRHLDEIDQSDPDLCYKYALHLGKMGPSRASGVIRWANVALENRLVWTGDTYTSRVYSLYKVRAAASQMLWQEAEKEHAASPSDDSRDKVEKYRNMTKVNAREWYEYAKSSGKDMSIALQLCISAAGTSDYCEAG